MGPLYGGALALLHGILVAYGARGLGPKWAQTWYMFGILVHTIVPESGMGAAKPGHGVGVGAGGRGLGVGATLGPGKALFGWWGGVPWGLGKLIWVVLYCDLG